MPGICVLVVMGVLARGVTALVPLGSELIVAVVLGMVVGNTVGVPSWAAPGVETNTRWLEAGIVLMGASVAVDQVIAAGPTVVVLIVAAVTTTVLTVELVARVFVRIPEKVGSLLAAGSGICGVSAVAAVAAGIRPTDQQVAYAAATILLFDAVTLLVYPAVGAALGLSDVVFGVWAGTTMFSTGPVTAAGFAYSGAAGQWAVLVKLARNALIGVVAVGYALFYSRRESGDTATLPDGVTAQSLRFFWSNFPTFVVGFVVVTALSSAGAFSAAQLAALDDASNWLFLFAFVGLGLTVELAELRETGFRPVLVVLLGLLTVSSVMLAVLSVVF
nr:putative sulfate exporter family transporter [Halomarina oriensis]